MTIETFAPPEAGAPLRPDDADPGFGVYVHWPFCLAKCPYCDFNSHVRATPIDEERFVAALSAELAHRAARIAHRLFAERPKAFRHRLEMLWEHGR